MLIFNTTLQNGSPVEKFVEMTERPSRAQAANFVTGTPLPITRSKRRVFGDISNNRMDARNPGRITPARHASTGEKSISATPTSKYSSVKRRKIDHSRKSSGVSSSSENIASQNTSLEPGVDEKAEVSAQNENFCTIPESSNQPLPSLAKGPPQYFTSDLVKACCVM